MCVFSKRLSNNLQAWKDIQCPQIVKNWISEGIRLPFAEGYVPGSFQEENYKLNASEQRFVLNEVEKLEITGAIERVQDRPHCVSPIKTVPKKGGKYRLITDLRSINDCIEAPAFQCEGVNTAADLISSGDYMVKTDLKDGFYHIPVHDNYRTFLSFYFNNVY